MKTQSLIKKSKIFALVLISFYVTSCLRKIPSDYELDKRGGTTPSGPIATGREENLTNYGFRGENASLPYEPLRTSPVITKVWVYDRRLGQNWLQGTWYYIEVSPSQWLNETEPHDNTFVKDIQPDSSSSVAPKKASIPKNSLRLNDPVPKPRRE